MHLQFEASAAHAFGGIDGENELEVDGFRPRRQDEQQEDQGPDPDHSAAARRQGGNAGISVISLRTVVFPELIATGIPRRTASLAATRVTTTAKPGVRQWPGREAGSGLTHPHPDADTADAGYRRSDHERSPVRGTRAARAAGGVSGGLGGAADAEMTHQYIRKLVDRRYGVAQLVSDAGKSRFGILL